MNEAWRGKHYSRFTHSACEFFPCHKGVAEEDFNCLFCYCPLYLLGDRCGGNFRFTSSGVKDCSACAIPHRPENYGYILQRLKAEGRETVPASGTEHGGDWAGFQRAYGGVPLDFSANVSPLGMPEAVRRAAEAAMADSARYPDPRCRALRERLAEVHGVPADWVLCGGGAADLIYRLAAARRPRRALVTAPTFSEYENALDLWGCRVSRFPLLEEEDFSVTEDILSAVTPEVDLVFLCEPNNPTGRTTAPALLERVLERCAACGAVLAVDECFNSFLDDPEAHTLVRLLPRYENLLILRAFTKSFAMAGLRLGYALSRNAALLGAMARSGPPWSVSLPAQAAGLAALEETESLAALRALTGRERARLAAGLAKLGCRVCPGEANYLLFFTPAPNLPESLAERGVLIRDCGNYHGLGPGWYRAAVRTEAENTAFLKILEAVL